MDFPNDPLHQATVFGLFLITDDYNLARLLRSQDSISRRELETMYSAFLRAVHRGVRDLGARRLKAERATYYNGNVRVYCGELFWHMGPTDPIFAPPQTEQPKGE